MSIFFFDYADQNGNIPPLWQTCQPMELTIRLELQRGSERPLSLGGFFMNVFGPCFCAGELL